MKHYHSYRHHCRFKIRLHCRILNRQWHVGSDARWLLLPVLHPTVIRFRKTKKAIQQACWLEHARYRRCRHHARWLPPPLHQAFHPRKKFIHHRQRTDSTHQKNSSTNRFMHHRRRRRVQHITNQPIHKSIRTSQTKEQGSTQTK